IYPDELLVELKPTRPARLYGSAGCETWSACFSPDGSRFAWSLGHGVVKVLPWPLPLNAEAPGSSEEKTLQCEQNVWGMAFGPQPANRTRAEGSCGVTEDLLLATGLTNGVIKVWLVSTGRLMFSLTGHTSVVRDLAFAPNGSLTLVSASRDKTLRVWDLSKKGTPSHVLTGPKNWVFKCSISPDSSMMASVCNLDSKAYLWSMRSYTFIRNLKYDHERTMVSCDFSLDGALLAIGSFHSTTGWWLDLWDPYTADHLAHCFWITLCCQPFLFTEDFLPLCNRALQVWDMEQDKLVLEADHNRVSGLCCAFHPQGSAIATGCRDGHVKFWRVPRLVPSLRNLCRTALRHSVSTFQVTALPLPKKILEFLTYRDIAKKKILRCSEHYR
uniref:WD repeat and SOCS box containing 2 n=1 Tax=Astyanax mexicanus TaxID=7994 RepID=A0A8B9JJX4_ASTMX